MIIYHSFKALDELSKIEELIQKMERLMDEKGVKCDRERILMQVLKNREELGPSRKEKN